jgi:hypothetical protein
MLVTGFHDQFRENTYLFYSHIYSLVSAYAVKLSINNHYAQKGGARTDDAQAIASQSNAKLNLLLVLPVITN